jgi:hypothetical protein
LLTPRRGRSAGCARDTQCTTRMARRLDAPARRLSQERVSFKHRVDRHQAAFDDDASSEVLSQVRSTSLGDVKMATERAIDETAIDETAIDEKAIDETAIDEKAIDETAIDEKATPEQLSSSELLRELIEGQRAQAAKLARIEARIGAVAPTDGAQRPDDSDEDRRLLADEEEVYGSVKPDSFRRKKSMLARERVENDLHRHAREVNIDDSRNGQPSPKQLLRRGLLHPTQGFRLCDGPPFELCGIHLSAAVGSTHRPSFELCSQT